ncbi:hypothetical protein DFJ43DRAFT_1157171 [Lentinula guzmanii]|uniref:Uncharacterized protein n=1 Tax=Lentinula guzmanii TaxID=2804957 RepID=A0AA38JED1_9AGAR|nr:hypothetical protein DFJ43DRAFT_1157171 [Lentinula guzmanii]
MQQCCGINAYIDNWWGELPPHCRVLECDDLHLDRSPSSITITILNYKWASNERLDLPEHAVDPFHPMREALDNWTVPLSVESDEANIFGGFNNAKMNDRSVTISNVDNKLAG